MAIGQGDQGFGGGFDQGTIPPSQGQEEGSPDSLANGFLNGIPEQDREVVGKYIKDWDAGVTRKFQEIHNTYRPYKDLGDIENVKQGIQLLELLESDPQYLVNQLAQVLNLQISPMQQGAGAGPVNGQIPGTPNNILPQSGGGQATLPPEVMELRQQIEQQQQLMTQMAEIMVANHQQSVASQEDQQLNAFLEDLHKKHGDFDDQWMLVQIANDVHPDQAISKWKQITGGGGNRLPNPPPAFSGGGVGANAKNVTEMNNQETESLVAAIIQQAQSQ